MICREEQEDTLKSLRLIPVDEVKLTLAKMILAFVFSVLIYLLLFAITFLVEAVLHLEALSVGLVLENLKIYFLDGVGVFFAISPIIALVARMKKGYWLALVFAEIYSFAGLFASYVPAVKDSISHDSRFQYLRLLRCKHNPDFHRCCGSAGLCCSGAVHSERLNRKAK